MGDLLEDTIRNTVNQIYKKQARTIAERMQAIEEDEMNSDDDESSSDIEEEEEEVIQTIKI